MGTSKSYDGPKDRTPLLPPWAFPEPEGENQSPGLPSDTPLDSEPANSQPPQPPVELPSVPSISPPEQKPMSWRAAKTALGRSVSDGSAGNSLGKAGRSYARALGGAQNASRSARAGRSAATRLGQFLSDIGNQGISEALQNLGLSKFIGKDAETVFAAISEALAPTSALREEAIAREAVNETLESLYEQYILQDGDITKLDQMNTQSIEQALETVVSAYIYNRWLGELEIVLEKKAISTKDAIKLERDMKQFIRESVHLDFQGVNILALNWKSSSGQQLIEKIFTDAYSILEECQ